MKVGFLESSNLGVESGAIKVGARSKMNSSR